VIFFVSAGSDLQLLDISKVRTSAPNSLALLYFRILVGVLVVARLQALLPVYALDVDMDFFCPIFSMFLAAFDLTELPGTCR